MSTKTFEQLLDDLNDRYVEPRCQAAIALRKNPDSRAIIPLLEALARYCGPTQSGSADLAIIAKIYVANSDNTLIEKYFPIEESPRKTSKPFLDFSHLDQSEGNAMMTSLIAIIKSLGTSSLNPLVTILTSHSGWTEKMIVAFVIRDINDVSAVKLRAFEPLFNLLQHALEEDFRSTTKEELISLVEHGRKGINVSSRVYLIKTIRDGIPEIILSLLWMSESASAQFFHYLASGETYARIAAAIMMGILKEQQAFQPLLDVLQSDTEAIELKVAAIDALGLIDAPRAVGVLAHSLQEDIDETLKNAIIKTLRVISHPDSILPIISCLKTGKPAIQAQAVKALESITGKRFLFGKINADKWQKWWTANKDKIVVRSDRVNWRL